MFSGLLFFDGMRAAATFRAAIPTFNTLLAAVPFLFQGTSAAFFAMIYTLRTSVCQVIHHAVIVIWATVRAVVTLPRTVPLPFFLRQNRK